MKELTAKVYLESKGLNDHDYSDSGMINHIAEMMEEYHQSKLLLSTTEEEVNTNLKSYTVSFDEEDEQGVLTRGIDVMADSLDDAVKIVQDVNKSPNIWGGIDNF